MPNALVQAMDATTLPNGLVAIWWLGQSTFSIKGKNVIYSDPFLSDHLEKLRASQGRSVKRIYPSPIQPEEVINADIVLVTHGHVDHLDPGSLPPIAQASPRARFVAPPALRQPMLDLGIPADRIVTARVDQTIDLDGTSIIAIPAAHGISGKLPVTYGIETDPDGHPVAVGFLIHENGVTVYLAGDTVAYDGLVDRLRAAAPNVGLLPINGRDWKRDLRGTIGNFSYREAADLAAEVGFDVVIPSHIGTLAHNTEHPGYFVDYLADNYPRQKYHVMARDERYVYVSPDARLT